MKKLFFIALMAITALVAKAQTTSYVYDEAHCWDIYERYIPNGYFDGPNGELIHYYGQGDFFVGHPKVHNPRNLSDYEFVVVHMDFRPLHRMVLSRGLASLAAVHLSFDTGWLWSISYANVYYDGRHYPEIHFCGNHSKWRYYASLARGYNYYDWNHGYSNLHWRNNHRPSYHSHFNSRHGDYRRHQYSGSSNYGYRMLENNGSRGRISTVNMLNHDNRRRSSESLDNGRRLIEREIETSRRGYTTTHTENYVNGKRVDGDGRTDYRGNGSFNGQTARQRVTTETEATTTTTNRSTTYQRGSATQNYGSESSSSYQRGSATQRYGSENSGNSSYRQGSATENYGSGRSGNSRSQMLYENGTSPRQSSPNSNVRDTRTTQKNDAAVTRTSRASTTTRATTPSSSEQSGQRRR